MGHRSRHGGTWRTTKQPSVRHGASWRTVSAAWVRQNGVWVKWWPDLPDRGGPYIFGNLITTGPGIAAFDGTVWAGVGGGLSLDIEQVSVGDDGSLLALQRISNGLRKWDGSSWANLGTAAGTSKLSWGVNAGVGYPNGAHFTSRIDVAGGSTADTYIAVDGALYTGWQFDAFSSIASVGQFAVNDFGCAAFSEGNFTSPGSGGRAWVDASDWSAGFASGSSSGLSQYADIAVLGLDRQIYATRSTSFGGGTYYVCRMATANTFTQLGSGGFGGRVMDIEALPDGRVWACGGAIGLHEWDGSTWTNITGGLSYPVALSFHQGLLWILDGSSPTARTVWSYDGTTLALVSNFTGDTVRGLS
jgi:hypothetical protein